MQPTDVPVGEFLQTVPVRRAAEAQTLLPIITGITDETAVMWGPSIIGFGSQEYQATRGTERMPLLAFTPRKAQLTVYFMEGFDMYRDELAVLGFQLRHGSGSISCATSCRQRLLVRRRS